MAGVSDRPRAIPFRYSSLCLAYTACASILFLFAPLVDAEYGSGTFVSVTRPAELEVRVSTTGLLMREVAAR